MGRGKFTSAGGFAKSINKGTGRGVTINQRYKQAGNTLRRVPQGNQYKSLRTAK